MFKCKIPGVRKEKMKIERKVLRKDFRVEILLSSCSLSLGFMLICKFKLKKILENFAVKKMFVSWVIPLVGRHVVKHG
jgi:hypothetical protein